ncbi:uncharacterized protein F5147DRAFT_577941 [Suillus discolor]|uniref:Uncharacterized protein n=1 Tax=Suillus discolor TaxID=1912936 RepID=A0A9P7F6K5_9AGAM|nr:uncharacterized protein F5147DRAFT_577941 [Suillus discolor]KAG2107254.1 hypothetical protein F5147DRAFT_577941 [Suillus discolor]
MAYIPQQIDAVSGDQYRYALTNFRIAHEKVEEQRRQLEEQEKQVALLRARIALLEGSANDEQQESRHLGGSSVDDFSIKNTASLLERSINRWAADIVRAPPSALSDIYGAALGDITGSYDPVPYNVSAMQVQNILRHAMSEVISSEIINNLVVTNSPEANVQLTRIHEHLFARNPVVACVWRRQTFSAAVETCDPEMTAAILAETLPGLTKVLGGSANNTAPILASAYTFSRMLHSAPSSSTDAFYRSFVPELGSILYPRQIELVRRCLKSERGEQDRVGATIFPGLVKVTKGNVAATEQNQETVHTVVRRAQVICECALALSGNVPMQG